MKIQKNNLNLLSHVINFRKICRKHCEKLVCFLCLGDFNKHWIIYLQMWEVVFYFTCKMIWTSHKICLEADNRLDGLLKSFWVSFPMTVLLESIYAKLTDLTTCKSERTADQLNQTKLLCSACSYCYLMSLAQLGTPGLIYWIYLVVPQYLLAGSEQSYVCL